MRLSIASRGCRVAHRLQTRGMTSKGQGEPRCPVGPIIAAGWLPVMQGLILGQGSRRVQGPFFAQAEKEKKAMTSAADLRALPSAVVHNQGHASLKALKLI